MPPRPSGWSVVLCELGRNSAKVYCLCPHLCGAVTKAACTVSGGWGMQHQCWGSTAYNVRQPAASLWNWSASQALQLCTCVGWPVCKCLQGYSSIGLNNRSWLHLPRPTHLPIILMNSSCLPLRWSVHANLLSKFGHVLSVLSQRSFLLSFKMISWEFSKFLNSSSLSINNSILKPFFYLNITRSIQKKLGLSFITWLRNFFSQIPSTKYPVFIA